ncbi:hypothetical protein F2Q69_00002193 [Brassica cretica]|uniref:Uncharacterized protein n=1 Tax=Brassica cretica TaxID=69181 RepID=A0A8S9PGB7_BRACR|nr:hypothetical protein F2Q69_00002193 [Brassica cretica]
MSPSVLNMSWSASKSLFGVVNSFSPVKIEFAPARKHKACSGMVNRTLPADNLTMAFGITILAVPIILIISHISTGCQKKNTHKIFLKALLPLGSACDLLHYEDTFWSSSGVPFTASRALTGTLSGRPIPHEDLKKLGIQLPPEGRYMSRTQIPSPPRRKGCVSDREEGYYYRGEERSPVKREGSYHSHRESESAHRRRNKDKEERSRIESRSDRKDRYGDKEDVSGSKRLNHGEERPHKRHKHRRPHHHRRSSSRDHHHSSDLDT